MSDSTYYEYDNDGNGIFESNAYIKVTYVFDMNGNPVHEEWNNGTFFEYLDRTFDAAGRPLTLIRTNSLNLYKYAFTWVYDASGNIVEETRDTDFTSDGIIDTKAFQTFCPQFIAAFVVPTLGQWALMILTLLMGIVGVVKVRQVLGNEVSI